MLLVVVDENGNTRDLKIWNGLGYGLDEAAIDAVKHWKYEPGTYQGKPTPVEIAVQVNFRLTTSPAVPAAAGAVTSDQFRNLYSDAEAAYSRQDYQTATNIARRLTSMAPGNAYAWNLLGMSLLELRELAAAVSAFETSVKLDPSNPYVYNNFGRAYWRQRKYEDAEAQYRKQIALNPDDHYAHTSLGMTLRDEKKCTSALPELEKALTLTPNNAGAMLALGQCNLDLGNPAKGLSYFEQATSEASSPPTWNSAAYQLALRHTELDRAQKWAEAAIAGESTQLQNISLEHLSTAQLSRVTLIASYWDTMGWVLFQRGNFEEAIKYFQAALSLRPAPDVTYHLGRAYEALSKQDEANHAYGLAIASADSPSIQPLSLDEADSVTDAKLRLSKSISNGKTVDKLIEAAHADLVTLRTTSIDNVAKANGAADFTVNINSAGKSIVVHQISGDDAFAAFLAPLQTANLPSQFAPGADVEIPRRGTLTCEAASDRCSFVLLNAGDAVDLARKESAVDTAALAQSSDPDPHTYNNSALGMRLSLPDQWQLVHDEPGTFSRPHTAMFGKSGTAAVFLLTREHMEGSADLYTKMIEASFSQAEEYRRTSESEVKRDGISGTRWNIGWKQKNIVYTAVLEFFSVGDDRYRLMALAPSEVYNRYSEDFENMLRSVRFPMLRNDPKLFEKP